MTDLEMPLATELTYANRHLDRSSERFVDQVQGDDGLLAKDAAFEKALLEELAQANDLRLLDILPQYWTEASSSASPDLLAEMGPVEIADGGLDLQNGVLVTNAAEVTFRLDALDSSVAAQRIGDLFDDQHRRVRFDGDIHATLTNGAQDHTDGHPPFIAGDPVLTELFSIPNSDGSSLQLATDHVFFTGEGRPIALDSLLLEDNPFVANPQDHIVPPNDTLLDDRHVLVQNVM